MPKIYTATIVTNFNGKPKINLCTAFSTEKEAIDTVMESIFEMELITRKDYLDFIRDARDDGHDDNGLVDKIDKMFMSDFFQMIYHQLDENPTIENLKTICREYGCIYLLYERDWVVEIGVSSI